MELSIPRVPRPRPVFLAALAALSLILGAPSAFAQTVITVDASTRFQTISGWECVSFASQDDPAFLNFKDELFDRVIDEAGINRIRLEVRSGAENSTDYFARYQAGTIDYAVWRANRYATVNDNDDPRVIDPDGFHFTELDRNIETTLIPLRDRAAARREPLYINLNYVAFTGQITQGGVYDHADPEEYGEFILAVFQHMDRQFGFVPDGVEILLEPDNVTQWNGTTVGNAIVAVASRLAAAGYSPEIIAPSCTNMGNAVSYFDALAAVPGALTVLDEVCYHRYGGVSDANLQAITARAQQHSLRTSMLEWWSPGNSIDVLIQDLTAGGNSAWQQGVLGGVGAVDDAMALYKIDVTDPASPVVAVNRKTRLLRQVYRFVRRGAVRIAATCSSGVAQPLAFLNTDGGTVVVVRATAGGSFTIDGLPAGTYGVNYSTATEYNVNLNNQPVAPGEALRLALPSGGAFTVFRLQPHAQASTSTGNAVDLTIRCLKPGFTGVLEHNTDLSQPNDWQQVRTLTPEDFSSTWSVPIRSSPSWFRFRQL